MMVPMPDKTTTLFDLPCVIFAGGKSSRMGRDKALLPFGGCATLAEYQYARLSARFTSVFVSVKRPEALPKGLPCIADDPSMEIFAPTVGFVSAFRSLDAERIFVLSVDTPFVDAAIIAALLQADRPDLDAVIARTARGSHPLCGLYHRRMLPRFEAMAASGEHKLGKLLQNCNTVYVDFEDESYFSNLNHPHEYIEAVEKIVGGGRPKAAGEEKHS
jgi:molybdenum cofactor guanylyltransferase